MIENQEKPTVPTSLRDIVTHLLHFVPMVHYFVNNSLKPDLLAILVGLMLAVTFNVQVSGSLSLRAIWATHCQTGKGEIFFLSDSTTRPSDLPLNVIVQSA